MKNKHNSNLRITIFCIVILCIISSVCVSTYISAKQGILSETKTSTCTKLSVGNNMIAQKISALSVIAIDIAENNELKEKLNNYGEKTLVEQFYVDNYILELFSKYSSSFIEISSMHAYIEGKTMTNSLVSPAESVKNTDWYKGLQSSKYSINIEPISSTNENTTFPNVFVNASIEMGLEKLGYVQIALSKDLFVNNYLSDLKMTPSSSAYIVDNNGNIIFAQPNVSSLDTLPDTELFSKISMTSNSGYTKFRNQYVYYSTSNGYGLKTVEVIPQSSLYSLNVLKRNTVLLFIVALILSGCLIYILVKRLIAASLANKFQFEYLLLREKINPHFLYNLLDAISWNAYSKEPEIGESLSTVASLYRKALKISIFTPLSNEFEYAKTYLTLTQKYLKSNIEFSLEYDSSVEDLFIPGFILQPIIENSIKHGFLNKTGVCTIKITATPEEDNLIITIVDNGNGIPISNQKNIFAPNTEHIGLANIQQRIQKLCGKQYGLSINSEETKSTSVSIKLPILHEMPNMEDEVNKNV